MSLRLFRPLLLGLCELEFLFCCKQWKYLLSSSFPPALHPSQAGNRVCSSSRDPVQLHIAYIRDLSPKTCEASCRDKSCDRATLAVDNGAHSVTAAGCRKLFGLQSYTYR